MSTKRSYSGFGGIDLGAEEYGDPDAPPVLLLPAGAQTKDMWRDVAASLAAAGRYAICVDLRGHGDSGWARDGRYDLDAYAQDVKSLLAQLQNRPVVIGTSIGGLAALMALGESEAPLATGLVLAGVSPWIRNRTAADLARQLSKAAKGHRSLDEAVETWAGIHPGEPRPTDRTIDSMLTARPDGHLHWRWDPRFLRGLDLEGDRSRLEAAAANINVPTLIVQGTSHDTVSAGDNARLIALIPSAEGAVVEGAGRMIASEQSDAFGAHVLEFLERRIPRAPVHYRQGADARTLRDALGCFGTGVTVVTAFDAQGVPIGLTANSFTSVSLDPPLILFCLGRNSRYLADFERTEWFAINVLHIGQQPSSDRFAMPREDRFADMKWTGDRAPLLEGSLASLECAMHAVHDGGDHIIVVGRVTEARFEPRRDPLLYFRGKYRRLHFA